MLAFYSSGKVTPMFCLGYRVENNVMATLRRKEGGAFSSIGWPLSPRLADPLIECSGAVSDARRNMGLKVITARQITEEKRRRGVDHGAETTYRPAPAGVRAPIRSKRT